MAQVRVTLCRLDLGMPQQALHLVQATSRVDQKAGVRVSQIWAKSNDCIHATRSRCTK